MSESLLMKFHAKILIIGVNPYVLVPDKVLNELFRQSKRDKGTIPVRGLLNHHKFIQTLVKYKGKWRLYLNTPMRKSSGTDVGDKVLIGIEYDPILRNIIMNPKLQSALDENIEAKKVYESLSPSRQKEIVRYIGFLKSEDSVNRNIERAIRFLTGKDKFVGRNKP